MTDSNDDDEVTTQDPDTAWFSELDVSDREAAQILLDELDQALARMLKKRSPVNQEPQPTVFAPNNGRA